MTYTLALAARIAMVTAAQIAPVLDTLADRDANLIRAFLVKDANKADSRFWGTDSSKFGPAEAAQAVDPHSLERAGAAAALAA